MARTSAFSSLRRYLLLAQRAERLGAPTREQIEEARWQFRTGRRALLQGAAAAALGAYVLPGCAQRSHAGDTHVGIVGAGMAGLLCGYRLRQAGVRVSIYDANTRTGGRMFTTRGKLADGQIAELGGELIDTDHATMRRLATEFGLTLDELPYHDADIREETFFFGGQRLSEASIVEAFRPLAKVLQTAVAASEKSDEEFARIDMQSIAQWLDAVPDLDPTLRKILDVAYTIEFGREIDEQSAFNLLWMIDSKTPDPFRIFGDSDERYHTHVGNGAFPDALTKKLSNDIELEHRLLRVRKLDNGKLRLTLDRNGKSLERDFDKVVLALPWTLLRTVEMDFGLPKAKRDMIEQLGYGTNAKVMGQTTSRVWLTDHQQSGTSFTDGSVQSTWDTSRGQKGKSGLLTVFLGGKEGASAGSKEPEQRMLDYLPQLDAVFPGTQAAYRSGSALRMHWPSAPLFLGSYACYLPGQAQWSGSEGKAVGNVHFAGEHTSEDFQGYMEGAAESGERVADEIFTDLGLV